ncbi:imidazolonepropionase [uncultured Microbacterium sp.]|uniref:Imidazolonepropionase n=1 Tax=uncultured Microbacterium sp. TaxID=191216 RepID=A0A1Y5NZD0_9MICO|nr:imidazolonepropionase [uncultured Microbacterium sp.]SBS71725.1 Imidazolonepropionase [uncultured Microbacterium sp.]
MSILIDQIGLLVTNDPNVGPGTAELANQAVVVDRGVIAWVGDARAAPAADQKIDARGGCVIPGFVDSHSHVMFAGDRAVEFEHRMRGEQYSAGGIRSTVTATRAAADRTLRDNAARLVAEMRAQGTTTVEIKSGYGLTVADEARALRIAREFTPETTFLGAHVPPPEYAGDVAGYVDLVRGPMLDAAAAYARWIDAFCEDGAFDVDQARAVITAGQQRGLGARLHAGQLGPSGGVALAVELDAAAVDHCTFLTERDIAALASSTTVATLLPGAEFSTRQPYPDVLRLLDAGVTVALATDCNPGSSYTSSMPLCIALAVREMRMTPAQALWSATAGGARALRRRDLGVVMLGAAADLVILGAPSYVHLAYRPGVPLVDRVLASTGTQTVVIDRARADSGA